MSNNPKNRPANKVRVRSMLLSYLAAFDSYVTDETQGDPREIVEELYNNSDYPPGLNNEKVVNHWHDQSIGLFRKLSDGPRKDKMKAYKIAAASFNSQLKSNQAGDKLLGIEPSRLNEEPATDSVIQVCVSRELKKDPEILNKILEELRGFGN